jgi:hypothetical protein
MHSTTKRASTPAEKLPEYLKSNLSLLQEFTKKLDGVSQEIRDVEASLQACGICVRFVHPTVNHGGWIVRKGAPDQHAYYNVSFLGWIDHKGRYRLVHGEAEQACEILPDGKWRARTGLDDFSLKDYTTLIETKAQVRLANADYLADFVKALTEHVDALTTRWADLPF